MRVVFLIFLSLITKASFGQLYGWANDLTIDGLGRDDAVCFTLDQIVFFGTGNHGGFNESNQFYAFNIRTSEWQDVAPFAGQARQYALVEEVEFKAYLIGGIDAVGNALKDVWEYDLASDSWSQKSDFPGTARWKAISFQIDGKIYYGSGLSWTQSFNDFWQYDPENDSWTQLTDMPFLPRNEAVSAVAFDKAFVGLGIDCTGVLHEDIWKYDPQTSAWEEETIFPGGPRYYAISESTNGKVFVGTGEDVSGTMHNDWWSYDPALKTWEQEENLPNPARRGTASCAVPFKGIFIAGGLSDVFDRLPSISRYTYRELNPIPLDVFVDQDKKSVFIRDVHSFGILRIVNLQGKLMYETFEKIDHIEIDVNSWVAGVYIVWLGDRTAKFYLS